MEVIIQLFLMHPVYAEPEMELSTDCCFTELEQEFMEHQIVAAVAISFQTDIEFENRELRQHLISHVSILTSANRESP